MNHIEGWKSRPLKTLLVSMNDKSKQVKATEYEPVGSFPIVDQSSAFICGYHYDPTKVIKTNLPLTVFGDHTRHTKFVSFPFVAGADGTQLLKPKREIEDKFFYYLVSSTAEKIGNYGYDRHFKHLKELLCKYPEQRLEQSKIAEVLSTVDRTIEQTEALIDKQQRIKTGLMQDLFTHGIDEHGELRFEATHEFKDSPLGRIPVEWDVWRMAQVLAGAPRNGIYKPANQIGSGTLLIGQTGFTDERRINYRLARRAKISISELSAYGLRDGDILVTRVFATVDGVGRPVLVSDLPEPAVYESNMLRLRIEERKIHPTLLFHWMRSSSIRKRIASSVNASNQKSVNQKVLNELPLPIMPRAEQRRIVETISAQERHIDSTRSYSYKLRFLKTGLMQDLLTGEKRITPLLEADVKQAARSVS